MSFHLAQDPEKVGVKISERTGRKDNEGRKKWVDTVEGLKDRDTKEKDKKER